MQSTKGHILALLKRHGRETVDALADDLGLAPMTVRQHLLALERDGLIFSTVERQRVGRPHYVFALTDKGDDSFPKRYDRLAAEVLSELGRLDAREFAPLSPAQRTTYLFDRIADRIVAGHARRLRDCSLGERVREVAAILDAESGFVDWAETEDGYEIRDYNCMYRRLITGEPQVCPWHLRVISQLVGRLALSGLPAGPGGACCRYVIPKVEPADAARAAGDGREAEAAAPAFSREVR